MSAPATARRPRERLASLKNPPPSTFRPTAGKKAPPAKGPPGPKATKKATCCDSPNVQELDGSRICLNCGHIVNESEIVSDVTFGENAAGGAVVVGTFVGENQRHANTMGGQLRGATDGMTSREQTEANGRHELRSLASSLHLSSTIEEQAFAIYKLAINHNFIQGRRTRQVAAVCLYLACRRNKENTTMLIDLAEKVQVNVFKLGEVYKTLQKDLWMEDPGGSGAHTVLEVEPLILKYAKKLEFGDKTYQVAEDAANLVKRMKRDWMVQGRQPAGLCGACLILAARMNNFRRTVREVVYIVKVADTTVFNRLIEFKRTESSRLSVDQFRKFGQRLKVKSLPPSIYKRAEKEERKRKRKTGEDDEAEESNEDSQTPSETAPKASKRRKVTATSSQQASTSNGKDSSQTAAPNDERSSQAQASNGEGSSSNQDPRRDADGFVIPELPNTDRTPVDATTMAELQFLAAREGEGLSEPATPDQRPAKRRKKSKRAPIVVSEEDLEIENELEEEINSILHDENLWTKAEHPMFSRTEQSAQALAEQLKGDSAVPTEEDIGDDEFDDDPEVRNCLLTPPERAVRERIWVTTNETWLREQQEKMLKKALEEASGGAKKKPTRKRKHAQMGDGSLLGEKGAASPIEAVQKMLQKRAGKSFSAFIDYERLQGVLDPLGTDSASRSASSSPAPSPSQRPPVLLTPPATQVRLTTKPQTRDEEEEVEEIVIEGDEKLPARDEAEEEEYDEEEEEGNPLGQLGLDPSEYYGEEEVGFEDDEGDY